MIQPIPAGEPNSNDTLIIGAGAAGLNAARALARGGQRVLLLEARDRLGGRIFTRVIDRVGADPQPVELGAEFVHGKPPATWDLIREARLDTYELGGRPLRFAEGRLVEGGPDDAASQVIDGMMSWLDRQPPGTDMSFDDYLARAALEPQRALQARAYVEGFNAADAGRIGIAALARQQRAEDEIQTDRLFHIRGGYYRLVDYLAQCVRQAGGDIRLECRVRRIRWHPGGVVVEAGTPAGPAEFAARRVVITLPLGVLQARDVAFVPEPGAALTHADALAMGAVVRLSLLFAAKPWAAHADLGFLFAPGETIPTWWTPMPCPAAMLTGWVGGPKAEGIERALAAYTDPLAVEDLGLGTLVRLFGGTASSLRALLTSEHRHDWQSDPLSRGAYSYVPAGALDASARLSEPVGDTLYFAGEHTDLDGHWGTVHAALKSGTRAAAQILGAPA